MGSESWAEEQEEHPKNWQLKHRDGFNAIWNDVLHAFGDEQYKQGCGTDGFWTRMEVEEVVRDRSTTSKS